MPPIAFRLVGFVKSYVFGRWHVVQVLSVPGNSTSSKPGPAAAACHVKFTVRLRPPWMAWMKYFEPADQPELVRFGLWQNEQVGPSLRCPAWKLGVTPSAPWQLLHFSLSTTGRRPV